MIAEQSAGDAGELIRTAPVQPGSESAAHFHQAAQALEIAARLVPFNSDYVYREAEACLNSGELDRAKSLIARAQQINPEQVDAYLLQANVELSRPNPDAGQVQADFKKILELNPNDVSLHVQYGDALERFGLPAQAREQFHLALKADNALPIGEPKRLSAEQVEELIGKAGGR